MLFDLMDLLKKNQTSIFNSSQGLLIMGRENRLNVADRHTDRQTDISNYRVELLPTKSLDSIL